MLKVWLPLDGDLRNLGASNIEVTNNGATVDNAGKIGKCYVCNSSTYFTFPSSSWMSMKPENNFSLFYWAKGVTTGWILACSGWEMRLRSDYLQISISGNGQYPARYTATFDNNTWYHIGFTWQGSTGTLKLFLNGQQVANSSVPSSALYNVSSTIKFTYDGPRYINDVRIYDHCLSAAEVREIAMGLVLHYKLDNGSQEIITNIPSTNVYNYPTFNTASGSGGWNHWDPSGHSGNYGQNTDKKYIYNKNNTYSHWISEDAGTGKHNLLYQSPTFEGGYRSLQAIIKEENDLPITESICYPAWNARNGGVPNNKWTSIKSLEDGFYYCCCEGVSQDGSNDLIGISVKPGYKIYVSECYLENNTEACSPIFSYSSNIIQDSSGYGHNGETVNEITISSDTPRYDSSTQFNGSNAAIKVPNNTWMTQGAEAITINLWAKSSAWTGAHLFSCTESGGFNTEAGNSGYLRFPVHVYTNAEKTSTAYKYDSKEIEIASLSTTDWNMLTFVYDSTGTRTYINSELHHTYTNSSYGIHFNTGSRLFLGCEASGASPSSPYFNGQISDFRIYYTALLDKDIKLLYNMGMRVDNLGEVHTFEFDENQSNLMWRPENARAAGLGINYNEGLGSHTQSNCQVTCDSNGYRIYRPPNLTVANNGNTMWGGLRIRNSINNSIHTYNASTDNIFGLIKGHTYIFIITVEGKSSNNFTSIGITNNMGWGGGGLGPNPSNVTYNLIGTNFNGKTECYYKFTISDDIVKTCTSSYSSFVNGNQYLSYMDFMFGFGYESTGSLGTDLYISNIRLFDLTNKTSKNIQKSGIVEFTQFIEKEENITKIRNDEELYATEFIEI